MDTCLDSILIIDDDDTFRGRLAKAFKDRDIEVFEAACWDEALVYVEANAFTKIVLDLKLASESGLDILKRLRHANSKARVVILTGYGSIATTVEALKSGAYNYLTKPVDADTILAAFGDASVAEKPSEITVPSLDQVEWEHIQRVLRDHDGNITRASKSLGLHRRSLQRKLDRPIS